jgi:hypothetical protein
MGSGLDKVRQYTQPGTVAEPPPRMTCGTRPSKLIAHARCAGTPRSGRCAFLKYDYELTFL